MIAVANKSSLASYFLLNVSIYKKNKRLKFVFNESEEEEQEEEEGVYFS